ncbi:MAG: hypothetical protein AAFN40_03310 [Cyanobacteria bacterium J06560_6]
MKKIPLIIIRTYLRRWPLPLRKSQFNVLSHLSWIRGPLEEIRDEFFPTDEKDSDLLTPAIEFESLDPLLTVDTLKERLQGEHIRGLRSDYRLVDGALRRCGNGYLLEGIDETSRQLVKIKYYRLLSGQPSPAELSAFETAFQNLVRLSHPDNQPHEDLRVIWPIDAIADFHKNDGYFMVMDEKNYGHTLKQWLEAQRSPLPPEKIRNIIGQVLQSLRHLHHQPVRLISDQLQMGLVHGNLSVDSVLCVERGREAFFYLSDLAIWEAFFQTAGKTAVFTPTMAMPTPKTVQKDLDDLEALCNFLLEKNNANLVEEHPINASYPEDKALENFLKQLKDHQFQDTEAAWQAWLRLAPLSSLETADLIQLEAAIDEKRTLKRWPWLMGGTLLALLAMAGGGWWLWRSHSKEMAALTCCLEQVESFSTDSYLYAVVEGGSWDRAVSQTDLFGKGLGIEAAIKQIHQASGTSMPVQSIDEAIDAVIDSRVEFAVVPLLEDSELPPELGYETIAYDGLAVLAPFNHNPKRGGLPAGHNEQMSLAEIRHLFTTARSPNENGNRYKTEEEEALTIFKQTVLLGKEDLEKQFEDEPVLSRTTPVMLRAMFAELVREKKDSVLGFAALSDVMKECSSYPLAISTAEGQEAVQPMMLKGGVPISPRTNLCDDKSLYYPDVEAFRERRYPLAYPIVVIFPQDNGRSLAGKKYADMMRTMQVQQLLLEANLVPLVDAFELADATEIDLFEMQALIEAGETNN